MAATVPALPLSIEESWSAALHLEFEGNAIYFDKDDITRHRRCNGNWTICERSMTGLGAES